MDKIINFINNSNFTIEELEKLITFIKEIINNNQNNAKKEQAHKHCYNCRSNNIIKNGHDSNKCQTYKCKDCGIRFNDNHDTIFQNTHLDIETVNSIIKSFLDNKTIREAANQANCSVKTSFLFRHKIISSLDTIFNDELVGETEFDEIYESMNFKGTPKNKMPRISKPRSTNGTSKGGINSHKLCILTAIDEFDSIAMSIGGNGPVTTEMLKTEFENKISNVTKAITDCKSSYEKLFDNKKIKHIQIKSEGHVDECGNSLANLNSIHSNWSTFISKFKGVSVKKISNYFIWFKFIKKLNYEIEPKNQESYLKNIVYNKPHGIDSNNIYDNWSGIDFDEVYKDYCENAN